jgi:hypothetical protein
MSVTSRFGLGPVQKQILGLGPDQKQIFVPVPVKQLFVRDWDYFAYL